MTCCQPAKSRWTQSTTPRKFCDDLVRWVDDRIESFLDAEQEGWRADPSSLPEHDSEIPHRDPDTVEQDELASGPSARATRTR